MRLRWLGFCIGWGKSNICDRGGYRGGAGAWGGGCSGVGVVGVGVSAGEWRVLRLYGVADYSALY